MELTNVSIPNSVIKLGFGAFVSNQLTSVNIPNNLEIIEQQTFAGNHLTTIALPSSMVLIEHAAFFDNDLTEIVVPNRAISIGETVFKSNELSNVIFLGNRPRISLGVFDNNLDLVNILYCSEATGWPGESIEGITPQLDETCEAQTNLSEPIQYAVFDIDQNGSFDALTDGLILLRYAFGLRGDSLINGVIASDAYRTSASEIEAHIQSYLP